MLPRIALVALVGSFAAAVAGSSSRNGGATCTSDHDCSLTGSCTAAKCLCDAAWTGPHCENLNLLPAHRAALYPAGGHPTALPSNRSFPWGGTIAKDKAILQASFTCS